MEGGGSGGGATILGVKGAMLGAEGAVFTAGSIVTGIFGLYGLALFAYEAWKWDTWEDIFYDLEYIVSKDL